jgi:redox-sensitive bicupin YhaK (pirin superfamily)
MLLRKSKERGYFDHGWLKTSHTFSFADYYDERYMGFATLRVINEDFIQGGKGFGLHGHRDMEIITYVVEGALHHTDSMGNSGVIWPGEIQRMSAGTGVKHSEFNELQNQTTHILQIWILPETQGITPGYAQKSFESSLQTEKLTLVASRLGRDASITLHQDMDIWLLRSKKSGTSTHQLRSNRKGWIQVIEGEIIVNNERLETGDGFGFDEIKALNLTWEPGAHFMLFDSVS